MNQKIDYIVYSDGGSRGNPGPAAYGFLVYDKNKKKIYQEGKVIGTATNNQAEYTGVLKALEYFNTKNTSYQNANIQFFLDSRLVVEQLSGNFKIKNDSLKKLFLQIKELTQKLEASIQYTHIRREFNKQADKLVNLALDQENPL